MPKDMSANATYRVPVAPRSIDNAAYASPYRGDESPATWRRPHGDRALAWSRIDRDDADLSPRRHAAEERALGHASSSGRTPRRFRPSDNLLSFLESL